MKKYYTYTEQMGTLSIKINLTLEDVFHMTWDPSLTREQNEARAHEYLRSKNATETHLGAFNEYQEDTRLTAIYPREKAFAYLTLGLSSEAGEVAGMYKKVVRDYSDVNDLHDMSEEWKKGFISELGDVLWYIARIADELDVSLSEVAERNIAKLLDRKKRDKISGSGDNR